MRNPLGNSFSTSKENIFRNGRFRVPGGGDSIRVSRRWKRESQPCQLAEYAGEWPRIRLSRAPSVAAAAAGKRADIRVADGSETDVIDQALVAKTLETVGHATRRQHAFQGQSTRTERIMQLKKRHPLQL